MYRTITCIFGGIILVSLAIYSYALIDPNLTLVNDPLWVVFRDPMVELGFNNRRLSGNIYLLLVVSLFLFHYLVMRKHKQFKAVQLGFCIAGILLFSYPFLSHDFFNYLFDAKIFTYYHQNPYLHTALEFPGDQWLRFMHWVHRPYPYGPTFLVLTIIPSFLSLGKFILSYFFFKLTFFGIYVLTVYYLQKNSQKIALQFATHPLVLMEGLVVLHNDLIAVCFALMGIVYLSLKNKKLSRLFIILSIGIKYLTLPYGLLLFFKGKKILFLALLVQLALIMYFRITGEWQPWYFLNLLGFLPYFSRLLNRLQILFAGLLFSYYPYVALGGWDKQEYIDLKNRIIWIAVGLNVALLMYLYLREQRKKSFSLDASLSSGERT